MKMHSIIILIVLLCITLFTCKNRDPINPLDPDNPTTHGQAYTIQVAATGIGRVLVHWRGIEETQVKGYRLYRSNGVNSSVFSPIASVSDSEYIDENLEPHTYYDYYYRILWEGGQELHQSPTSGAWTFDAPTGIIVKNVTRTQVELQWNDLHWLDNYAQCRIYRRSVAAYTLYDSTTSSSQYIDTRVDTGITYRYKLVAVGTNGSTSNYSEEKYATPGNVPPVIDSLVSSQPFTSWGEQVSITCYAHDADGDPIMYSWHSLDSGTITGLGSTITFNVPLDSMFSHRVSVGISDNYSIGGTDTLSVISAQLVLSDNFDSYSAGTFPSSGGWRMVWDGAGSSYQTVTAAISFSAPNSMQMEGQSGWAAAMDHVIVPGCNIIWFEVRTLITAVENSEVSLWNASEIAWGRRYCRIGFSDRGRFYIGYYDGNHHTTDVSSYLPNQWYKLKVKYDAVNGTETVWIDDSLQAQDYPVLKDGQGYRQIELGTGWGSPEIYYDDLRVWIQ
jgi:hypothetical protein